MDEWSVQLLLPDSTVFKHQQLQVITAKKKTKQNCKTAWKMNKTLDHQTAIILAS